MTLVVIIYGARFGLYKVVMTNDLPWFTYGFTWKGVTTGLAHCAVTAESKFLTHFLVMQAVQIRWWLTVHLRSQASLTSQPLTLDPLDLHPYVLRLMNALFLPPRQQLVSVHFRMVWKSTSETGLKRVIHHNRHLVIIILSQGYVNGCMVKHMKALNSFKMFSRADGNPEQPRLV